MSVRYVPVQWNTNKWVYDLFLILGAGAYLWVFLYATPSATGHTRPISPQIHAARAFGSCAFLMLTLILCIGPLARLDARFLPLLYNRRHFGVLTALVALTHVNFVLDWYYAFSPTPPFEALLATGTGYDRLIGFPFEAFGIFAVLVLLAMAATSHDFWMKFLTPRLWKRLHMLIYPAYGAAVAHVALGALQDQDNLVLAAIVCSAALSVSVLHIAAAWHSRPQERQGAEAGGWVPVATLDDIRDGFAKVARLPNGERVAVFRDGLTLSAISNACAHQNGPLGEGRIVDGCVTCPWHGFQYRLRDGCSPAPFTEKVPTYRLRLRGEMVEVDIAANAPGTPVEPLPIPEWRA